MSAMQTTEPQRQLAVGIWTAAALTTAVLISRRLGGAITTPIPMGLGMLWSTILLGMCALAAWLLRHTECLEIKGFRVPGGMAVCLSSVIGGAAILAVLPLWTAVGLGIFLGLAVLAAVMAVVFTTSWELVEAVHSDEVKPASLSPIHESVTVQPEIKSPVAVTPAEAPVQTQVRRVEMGTESIEGTVHMVFAEGQREQTVHVAFCPALGCSPEVELEDLDGHDWEVKLAAAFPYGLRIHVRRRLDAPMTGDVGYMAVAAAVRAAA
ncbi:hypothetical protein GC163_05285 [bacterium]|nr:hypothetical protein [bacterium]